MDLLGARSDSPAVCPRLIGRDGSFGLLTGFVGEARAGRGRTVLISGEAGIGKSRLVAEVAARVTAPDGERPPVLVLRGTCFEPDRACPYAPLIDLLRNHFVDRSPEEIAAAFGPAAGAVATLLPEIAPELPGGDSPPPLAPEYEKRRLRHALQRFFTGLAAAQPLLAIAEDVHWSDDSSLEFLLALARHVPRQRILFVLTYRSDEVHPGLRHALAEFDRERLATEITLVGLDRTEVEAMVRAILRLDRAPRADVVEAIFSLTDGNPFFIEEVLRSLGAAGRAAIEHASDVGALEELAVPRTVQDSVHQRLATVSPDARRVLDLAAVAGRRFDFALLRALTALDEVELLGRIKEAIAAQLVVAESADRSAFRHALTRQAIYGLLHVRERRDLHRLIAEQLEIAHEANPELPPGDLAYHFLEAGDWSKAVAFSELAAERALALDASTAAIVHVNRGLAAAAHLTEPPAPSLYRMRGSAYETLGDFERARADFQAALDLARARGDRRAEWRALLDLGALSTGHDYEMAGHFFRAARDLALTFPDRYPFAQSLNRLGNWHVNTGRVDEAAPLHQQALAVFQQADDRRATAETLDLLGMTHGMGGDLRASVDYYDRAIAGFRAIGDRRGLVAALAGRLVWQFGGHFSETVSCPSGDLDAMRAGVADALALARALDWPAMESFVRLAAGPNFETFGAIGEGLTHLNAALRIAREIGHQQWTAATQIHIGRVYCSLLHGTLAVQAGDEGLANARRLRSAIWITVGTGHLALAHILAGDLDRAEAVLNAIPHPATPPGFLAERHLSRAWGQLALARGDAEAALGIADALLGSVPGADGQPVPGLLALRGEALLQVGRPADAVDTLAAAKRGAVKLGAATMLWRIRGSLARALSAAGRAAEASVEAAGAHTALDALAGSVGDDALRDHLLRAGHASLPDAPAFGGLTARERDVALLLARRLSNREIAEALFVGERTVESHVASILGKLGCSSRAQVATWLIDRELVERPG